MDNKHEKTFADIFSSTQKNNDAQETTFSNILNDESKKETNKESSLTFDSIFDKLSVEEEQPEKIMNDENKDNEKEINTFKDIFNTKEEKKEETNDIETKAEVDDIEKFVFAEEEVYNEKKETNNTSVKDIVNDENEIFTSKEQIHEENNSNPFFEQEDTEKNIEQELKKDDNPFFNQEINQQEKVPEETTTNDNNPFFNDDINNNASIEIEQKENIANEEESNNIIIDSKKEENHSISALKKEEDLKNDPPKSTSPFFQEEEKPAEENPFFQQQINLVENETPTNTNGNIDLTNIKHYNVKVVKKKEPLMKMILGIISYAMFIFLLLIGVTLLVYVLDIKIRQSKGDYSSPTFNAYVVLTGSMLPEIQVKDVVVTKKIPAKNLKVGDVITFASSDSRFQGTIITHRIIKKNPKTDKEGYTFQTKGDNNNVADSALVTENNIFGKVIVKIPKLGYLQEFLATDGGWIIVILIPCLTVISYDIVKLVKGLKRKKYKNIKVQK